MQWLPRYIKQDGYQVQIHQAHLTRTAGHTDRALSAYLFALLLRCIGIRSSVDSTYTGM
jgi:hypothetical protein